MNTALPPDAGSRWTPGPYQVRGLPFWDRDRYVAYATGDTALGPFMMAEVRLAVDTINLNGQFDFDSNHKNDLGNYQSGYLPHGSEAGDGGPGPWANRVIAYLWGLEEEMVGNNWGAGIVNKAKWPGRPWGELPAARFHYYPTSYQGWCSNRGSSTEPDYLLFGAFPSYWTFGQDGMIKLDMQCMDYGGSNKVKVDLLSIPIGLPIGEMTIPLDQQGNNIADVWESKYESMQPDEDVDKDNAGVLKGDGLSNIDEYRGFDTKEDDNITTKHVRTNPTKRDVFVYDPDNIFLNYRNVLSSNPALICYHRVNEDQMGPQLPGAINATQIFSGIIDRNGRNQQYTTAYEYVENIGYPARSYTFKVDGEKICLDTHRILDDERTVDLGTGGVFYQPHLEYIVAHEMGHKYGLQHNERYLSFISGFNFNNLINDFDHYQYYEKSYPDYSNIMLNLKLYKYMSPNHNFFIVSDNCCLSPIGNEVQVQPPYYSNIPPYETVQYDLIGFNLSRNPRPSITLSDLEDNIMDWIINYAKPQKTFNNGQLKLIEIKSK